ncbi:MAG: CoA pyrophosphatase [Vicinamibacterales bacterium]
MTASLPDIASFLDTRLAAPLPGRTAQWRFAPTPALKGWDPGLTPDTARQAAALILLYPGAGGVHLPLTVRRHDLPQHAGQVSLPGGAIDPGETPMDAALREVREEIGVDPASVRVLGRLSSLWVIVSNFVLHPFVGIAEARPDFLPDPREVATLVEAPLAELHDPARLHWHKQRRGGILIDYPYFDVAGQRVWGATAMVLGEFASLWNDTFAPPDRPR